MAVRPAPNDIPTTMVMTSCLDIHQGHRRAPSSVTIRGGGGGRGGGEPIGCRWAASVRRVGPPSHPTAALRRTPRLIPSPDGFLLPTVVRPLIAAAMVAAVVAAAVEAEAVGDLLSSEFIGPLRSYFGAVVPEGPGYLSKEKKNGQNFSITDFSVRISSHFFSLFKLFLRSGRLWRTSGRLRRTCLFLVVADFLLMEHPDACTRLDADAVGHLKPPSRRGGPGRRCSSL